MEELEFQPHEVKRNRQNKSGLIHLRISKSPIRPYNVPANFNVWKIKSRINSALQLFEPACLVYLLLDVWPLAKLADLFPKEGVKNSFLGK
jgi:hypothetical protein